MGSARAEAEIEAQMARNHCPKDFLQLTMAKTPLLTPKEFSVATVVRRKQDRRKDEAGRADLVER